MGLFFGKWVCFKLVIPSWTHFDVAALRSVLLGFLWDPPTRTFPLASLRAWEPLFCSVQGKLYLDQSWEVSGSGDLWAPKTCNNTKLTVGSRERFMVT